MTRLASPAPGVEPQILANLSSDRFATYRKYGGPSATRAWAAYAWNSRVAAVLFQVIAHLEVTVRNSVHTALVGTYGPDWHYDTGFLRSLPTRHRAKAVKSRKDLERERRQPKVDLGVFVASQTLSFWQGLLTSRHAQAIWTHQFSRCFPGTVGTKVGYQDVQSEVDKVRNLRNRIAHHEPLLKKVPVEEYRRIIAVTEWSCPPKARWVADHWPMTEEFDGPP